MIIKVDTQRQGHVCDIIFRKISIFVLLGLTIFVPFASITARAFLHMTMMARKDSILRKEGGCVCVCVCAMDPSARLMASKIIPGLHRLRHEMTRA